MEAGDRRGPAWIRTIAVLAVTAALTACAVPQTTVPQTTVPQTTVARTTGPRTTGPRTTGPRTTGAAGTAPPGSGSAAIGTTVLALVDRSRPTVSHGRPLSAQRALTTVVWYPQAAGPHPLVVFAHGYRIGVGPYRRACQALAQEGFVVAAPSFPLTDQTVAGTALDEGDTVNQPADMSFVITQLLAANGSGSAGSPLSGRIDPRAIAAVGHSDGADTVLALGYLSGSRDPRVAAIVADGPDPLPRPAGPPLVSAVPLLLIHGDHDTISPFSGSQRLVTQLRTRGWFLVLRGADHLPPIQGGSPWTAVFDRVTADFLVGILTNDSNLGPRLSSDVAGAPASLMALA
jgi:dienelactone hydrolase